MKELAQAVAFIGVVGLLIVAAPVAGSVAGSLLGIAGAICAVWFGIYLLKEDSSADYEEYRSSSDHETHKGYSDSGSRGSSKE
jgi:hypothetical protein